MLQKLGSFRIDNVKVKNKLLLLYIVCVLAPIILINTVFYTRIVAGVREREVRQMELALERVQNNIIKDTKECFAMANTINADVTLHRYLDTKYENDSDYAAIYHEYLRQAVLKYIPAYSQVERITIFTDNNTITDSTGYTRITDEIKNEDWFRLIMQSDKPIQVVPTIEPKPFFEKKNTRYLSILVRLEYQRNRNFQTKLLKIDVNPGLTTGLLEEQKAGARFYLLDPANKVIYSTDKQYVDEEVGFFTRYDSMRFSADDLVLERNFGDFDALKGWRVVGAFNERKLFAALAESRNFVIVLTLVSLLVASFFILIISRSLNRRLGLISRHMNKVRKQDFEVIDGFEGQDEIGDLVREFNRMTVKIKSLIHDVYEASLQKQRLELERKQSQMNALQSQINPHYLFNTLESIRMDCVLNDESKAARVLRLMSRSFRRMLEWGEDLVRIEEEVSFLEEYCQIQQFRFEGKLLYRIHLDEPAKDCLIPKMTFQPLVENAVVHGIREKKGIGSIQVSVVLSGNQIVCRIADDGVGIQRYRLEKLREELTGEGGRQQSIGMKNVYERLCLFSGASVKFSIDSREGEGTCIEFTFPALRKESGGTVEKESGGGDRDV